MIAKLKIDGREHMAVVFDECCDTATVLEIKHALNSFMQTFAAMDENQDFQTSDETYNLHRLLGEMEFTEQQANNILALYFGDRHFNGQPAQRKDCEIYI